MIGKSGTFIILQHDFDVNCCVAKQWREQRNLCGLLPLSSAAIPALSPAKIATIRVVPNSDEIIMTIISDLRIWRMTNKRPLSVTASRCHCHTVTLSLSPSNLKVSTRVATQEQPRPPFFTQASAGRQLPTACHLTGRTAPGSGRNRWHGSKVISGLQSPGAGQRGRRSGKVKSEFYYYVRTSVAVAWHEVSEGHYARESRDHG